MKKKKQSKQKTREEINKTLRERVGQAVYKQDMTVGDFADAMDELLKEDTSDLPKVTSNTFKNWLTRGNSNKEKTENTRKPPTISAELIPYIAEYLNCSYEYLYGENENPATMSDREVCEHMRIDVDKIDFVRKIRDMSPRERDLLCMLVESGTLFEELAYNMERYVYYNIIQKYDTIDGHYIPIQSKTHAEKSIVYHREKTYEILKTIIDEYIPVREKLYDFT